MNLSEHLKLEKIKEAAKKIFTPSQDKHMTCIFCKDGIDDTAEPMTAVNAFGAIVKVCYDCQVERAGKVDLMLTEISCTPC